MNNVTAVEYKDYVKFLGVLIDKHLTWKQHIDYIASDQQNCWFNREIAIPVPLNTLLQIYRSLVFPHMYYGIASRGQAAQAHLRKILVLQKRALRFFFLL